MKFILSAVAAAALSSCQTPATTTPKPDISPVRESNARTQKSIDSTRSRIKDSRTRIKESQQSSDRGIDKLNLVEASLRKLLGE